MQPSQSVYIILINPQIHWSSFLTLQSLRIETLCTEWTSGTYFTEIRSSLRGRGANCDVVIFLSSKNRRNIFRVLQQKKYHLPGYWSVCSDCRMMQFLVSAELVSAKRWIEKLICTLEWQLKHHTATSDVTDYPHQYRGVCNVEGIYYARWLPTPFSKLSIYYVIQYFLSHMSIL